MLFSSNAPTLTLTAVRLLAWDTVAPPVQTRSRTARESSTTRRATATRGSGVPAASTAQDAWCSHRETCTRGSTWRDTSRGEAASSGAQGTCIAGSGSETRCTARAPSVMPMAMSIAVRAVSVSLLPELGEDEGLWMSLLSACQLGLPWPGIAALASAVCCAVTCCNMLCCGVLWCCRRVGTYEHGREHGAGRLTLCEDSVFDGQVRSGEVTCFLSSPMADTAVH